MLAAVALSWSAAGVAWAAGTTAGTTISNTATVDFTIGAVVQPTVSSTPVDFMVDRHVDLTLTAIPVTYISVTPATTGNGIGMTLTNTSNAALDFQLAANNIATDPFGGTDNFDPAVLTAVVDNGDSICDAGDIGGATTAANLGEDASVLVCVLANIAGGTLDGSIAAVELVATARELGGAALVQDAGADDPATMQTVFGDGDGDGSDVARDAAFSDDGSYLVVSADVTIAKTETLISDPVNGAVTPRHIPGAVVQYQITVTNDAGSSLPATALTISDVLQAEVTFNPDTYGVGLGIDVDGSALTNAADLDAATFNGTDTVTVTVPALAPGASVVITFQATVD
jgi:uncharacterized repeat protein (TIGR01451 family)